MNNIHAAKPIPPLLRRTQLLPGESLPSLLERLAQLNYYPSLRMLSCICCDHMDTPTNQDDLLKLYKTIKNAHEKIEGKAARLYAKGELMTATDA